ncbi:MAG: M14 family metallopeptidase [Candidatus Aminicenantales bacterium]
MIRNKLIPVLSCLVLFIGIGGAAARGQQAPPPKAPAYHKPAEVGAQLKAWVAQYPALARLESIGKSAGGRDIQILRLAGPGPAETRPAVLVSANLEGGRIVGTEAALRLAEKLLAGYAKDKKIAALLDARTIYVAPQLDPDGSEAYFGTVRTVRFGNDRPVDEDADGVADEDGFEDLDKDGAITQMRVKDPEGRYIPDPKEPRLMRLADAAKGEKGIYRIYSEGLDNDGDGEYNEDPAGGVEINRNFPHDFEYFAKTAGLYPVSEPETAALLKFMNDHPQIAVVLNFSSENTILNQKQTGQAKPGSDKIKLPKELAGYVGLEADQDYTLKEIAVAATAAGLGGGMEITEEMIAGFLGQGAAVEIDKADQPILDAVQKDYKEVLKTAKMEGLEKHAMGVGKGSFAAYVYFQYGAPVFSTDIWQVPEQKKEEPADKITADKLKEMTSEQFLALGEEKIDAFLKDAGAPPNFNGKMLMEMVKSDKIKPAQMAEMMAQMPKKPGAEGEDHPDAYKLKYAEAALGGRGFTNWAPFKHPQLGDVEIGGFCPHFGLNPPTAEMDGAINAHVDFYLKLMDNLPVLDISAAKAEPLGEDVYKLSVYFSNAGRWPTSTAQGRKARSSWPIRVTLGLDKGQSLFSGRPAEEISVLNGGETKKLEWTIRAKKGSKVAVKAWAPKLGTVEKTVVMD